MAVLLDYLLLCLLKSTLLSLITVEAASEHAPCDFGHYYDLTKGKCMKCSVCPANHIIDKACTEYSDLKCVLFTFKDFPNFASGGLKLNLDYQSSSSKDIDKDQIQAKLKHVNGKAQNPAADDKLTTVENGDQFCKTLAFALIGVLSVLIIATFIILVFVYRKLQRSIVIKQPEEGDLNLMDDADSGYVVIRSIHHMTAPCGDNPLLTLYQREPPESNPPQFPPSGPTSVDSGRPTDSLSSPSHLETADGGSGALGNFLPKLYQPQRRLLNYDADDVFESDDSAIVNHPSDPKENLQPLIEGNNT